MGRWAGGDDDGHDDNEEDDDESSPMIDGDVVNPCSTAWGTCLRRPLAFLPWLVLYGLAVPGALGLAVLVPLTVIFRWN